MKRRRDSDEQIPPSMMKGVPMSVCTCGHAGDVRPQEDGRVHPACKHAGMLGHGRCVMQGCGCEKFTWADFISGNAIRGSTH